MKHLRFTVICISALLLGLLSTQHTGATTPSEPAVRNIIFMVGDGMGFAHLTAFLLNKQNRPIAMERAQATGFVRTHSANNRVTDSAAASTALATGHKTKNRSISVDTLGHPLETILEKAQQQAMGTGLVVTCDITDATPAGFYAHTPSRYESEQIAAQLVDSKVDVWIGAGGKHFDRRSDGRNLLEEFRAKGYTLITDTTALDRVHAGRVAAPMAQGSNMPWHPERGDYLPKATAKTLELLAQQSDSTKQGFFLLIEGSRIDHAAHKNDLKQILEEMCDFDHAAGIAMDFADQNPGTLVIIVADHETGGLTINSNSDVHEETGDKSLAYRFSTGDHTGCLVPLMAYGTGASRFGHLLDNTQIHDLLCQLAGLEQ